MSTRMEAPRAIGESRRLAQPTELWVVRALLSSTVTSVLLAALVIGLYTTGSAPTKNVIQIFLAQLLVVLGLQVFTGNSGVISFGHIGFMAIGGYTAALMSLSPETKATQIGSAPAFIRDAHFAYLPATLIAIGVTCLIALPIGFVFARLDGAAAAIATLAGYVIAYTVIANWDTITHGTFTLYAITPQPNLFWWMLGWAVVAIVAARLFRESGLGLGLRASSADGLVARAVGVNMTWARCAAWVISAGIAAVGGALYMKFLLSLAPTTFSFALIFTTLVMFIVGGRSVSGAVIGATIIAIIAEALRREEIATGKYGLQQIVLAVIFMAIVIFRSEGLLGRWELDELLVRGARAMGRRGESEEVSARVGRAGEGASGEGRPDEHE